jgi:hypothetical protein
MSAPADYSDVVLAAPVTVPYARYSIKSARSHPIPPSD